MYKLLSLSNEAKLYVVFMVPLMHAVSASLPVQFLGSVSYRVNIARVLRLYFVYFLSIVYTAARSAGLLRFWCLNCELSVKAQVL